MFLVKKDVNKPKIIINDAEVVSLTDNKPIILYSRVHSKSPVYFKDVKPHRIYINQDVFKGKTPLSFGVYTHLPISLKKTS